MGTTGPAVEGTTAAGAGVGGTGVTVATALLAEMVPAVFDDWGAAVVTTSGTGAATPDVTGLLVVMKGRDMGTVAAVAFAAVWDRVPWGIASRRSALTSSAVARSNGV